MSGTGCQKQIKNKKMSILVSDNYQIGDIEFPMTFHKADDNSGAYLCIGRADRPSQLVNCMQFKTDASVKHFGNVDLSTVSVKLPTNCVASEQIKTDSITGDKIASGSITQDKLVGNIISSAQITDRSVTNIKIQQSPTFDGTTTTTNFVANGTATIGGVTTIKSNDTAQIVKIGVNATQNAKPAASKTKSVSFVGTDNKVLGELEYSKATNGTTRLRLKTTKQSDSTFSSIDIGYNASGAVVTHAPTPVNTSNDTSIATTAYVVNSTHVVHTSGNETINGNKTFTAEINGTAIRAKWADLAEKYLSDKDYEPGTLIKFGGEKEITIASDGVVNGIVSTKPAFLLNAEEEGLPVALCGRVPVRVIGKVNKGDRIYLSEVDGVGIVADKSTAPIGIALETKETEDENLVMCVTKFTLF